MPKVLPWCLNLLIVASPVYGGSLTVNEGDKPVVCFQDPDGHEWSNSFLVRTGVERLLIDAGWEPSAQIPKEWDKDLREATKVATHFHYDHIGRWGEMGKIWLSTKQQARCDPLTCEPALFDRVYKVSPFSYDHVYTPSELLPAGVEQIPCGGHSRTDTCFIHAASKTLFLGDLFYPGPVFVFLPGGSVDKLRETLRLALSDPRWDRLALTHGECFVERRELERFAASLQVAALRERERAWTFDFWLPLQSVPTATGTVVLWPFQ